MNCFLTMFPLICLLAAGTPANGRPEALWSTAGLDPPEVLLALTLAGNAPSTRVLPPSSPWITATRPTDGSVPGKVNGSAWNSHTARGPRAETAA